MIPAMIEAPVNSRKKEAESIISDAREAMREKLGTDYQRLEHLKEVNDNIRDVELTHARRAITKLDRKLSEARLRLDAIRVISAN